MRAPESHHSVEIDGRAVGFFEVGPKTAPALLCLHGFPDAPENLLPLARSLAESLDRRVLVPAMPGYAPSAPLPRPSPVRVADHLLAFAGATAPGPLDVIGHDWGAVAAYTMANRAPGRLRRSAAAGRRPGMSHATPGRTFFRGVRIVDLRRFSRPARLAGGGRRPPRS